MVTFYANINFSTKKHLERFQVQTKNYYLIFDKTANFTRNNFSDNRVGITDRCKVSRTEPQEIVYLLQL